MKGYRRDIDGLRAIAVLPVVFSHAGVAGFSGGFVGVDVFFVISGFLITGILAREIDAGRFSLLGFYERRARRILPALFAMLTICLAVGYALCPPWMYSALAKSAVATIFFSSNMWFLYSTGDYFGNSAEYEPLLHTWSLAVEEQFYLVFPLLLWGLARWRKSWTLAVIAGLSAVSFVAAVWATQVAPLSNFFLTPLRAWELGLGALLALGAFPGTARRGVVEVVAAAGLAAICASIVLLTAETPFPGLAAAPTCLGAAAIIWAGGQRQTWTGRLLSTRAAVGVGLISYSLYLWHWPPLVVARLFGGSAHIEAGPAAALIVLSLVLAVLSWRFVERPFRARPVAGPEGRRSGFGRGAIFALSGIGAAALTCAGVLIYATNGVEGRVRDGAQDAYEQATRRSGLEERCLPAGRLCTFGAPIEESGGVRTLIWGDSHAAAMLPGLEAWLRGVGRTGAAAVKLGCPPLLGLIRRDLGVGHDCAGFNAGVVDWLDAHPNIDTVVLVGRWALIASGTRPSNETQKVPVLALAAPLAGEDTSAPAEIFETGLRDTLAALQARGRKAILIEGVPEVGFNVPRAFIAQAFLGIPPPPTPTRADYAARSAPVDAAFDRAEERFPIERLSVADLMCAPDCRIVAEDAPLYRDDDHLSIQGARWLVARLFKSIE
ncbi:Peptidoglycan/LPS O-acetylase OafA/YrhL, contains acyltransferase and SGNH-hydrolase domains [Albimonas donghaensis]|uniref:Peptidoglycan/LPS O-acetylase OafA/YrhL, contains acyltransferase and SGNH-hydrolase domains n=1 Tax=Albimonas donghaensis TaxID=356660 RepID=A0A1H3FLM7_9RHOB|nr:acyltransferase family protein [Albimonas donghaensis]SDX91962.1 Peptidoglycan/LPS O-acetylase OafA/YrhL, contains acyltransferase and SGNH-hydrolase domains [Albimonas donghaensis]